jgi:murein DD-endopeptidase MepM/ murein hydrolase activator NlpD
MSPARPTVPVAFLSAVLPAALLLAADLPGVGSISSAGDGGLAVPGRRQRRVTGPLKRGVHELKDPAGWPAEPPPVVGAGTGIRADAGAGASAGAVDAARFDAAVVALCGEVAPAGGLPALARVVREVSAETRADPFLMAALVYRQSRCRASAASAAGIGLLQIQPSMFAAGARLPFPREDLARDRLLDPAHNLRIGAALLAMWEAEHAAGAMDLALGSTPHRTAVAHFVWGDRVWGATAEDRALVARRRLLDAYAAEPPTFAPSPLGLEIVSPLEGAPRLGTSGPGADRDGGERSHRGLDVDATVGEPVRAVADGVVQFAGVDLPGRLPARGLLPRQLRRWRGRNLGPGGFFVRVVHAGGIRSGYFHLNSYRVLAGQTVRAGEVIGTVGRTGVKVSGSHLHFEVHQDGELADPVRFLTAYVLPPEQTITHELAMAEKKQRLDRERRLRRHARIAARHRLS